MCLMISMRIKNQRNIVHYPVWIECDRHVNNTFNILTIKETNILQLIVYITIVIRIKFTALYYL